LSQNGVLQHTGGCEMVEDVKGPRVWFFRILHFKSYTK